MKNILIIGATSAIASACARNWAVQGSRFFLVGRNGARLKQVGDDLVARGAVAVTTHLLDVNDIHAHADMMKHCSNGLGAIDIVLIASGTLPSQKECETDPVTAVREFTTNCTAVIALLTIVSSQMAVQRHGTIAVISSVAGDRGRPSNYLYGSAKAALSTFCEGLSARLFKVGVHVLTIKPGFVATPMTAELGLSGPLLASPEKVANDITSAIEKKRDVLYTLWFWKIIMTVIKSIPKFIFKRISL